MMNIEEILNDLYALDGRLREHESELKLIIGDLIKIKPDVRLDENFVKELRAKLLAKEAPLAEKRPEFADVLNYIRGLKRMPYFLGGAAFVLAVVIFAGIYFSLNSAKFTVSPQQGGEGEYQYKITQLSDEAFGSLAALSPSDETVGLGGNYANSAPKSESAPQELSVPAGMGGGGGSASGVSSPAIIVSPPIPAYEYVYKGDEFSVPDDKMAVYKKTDNPINLPFSQVLSKFDFGGIDLGNFSSAKIDNLTFSEDRQFGYTVNIDFKTGTLSIYKNWEKWPQNPGYPCQGGICPMMQEGTSFSTSDIPSDSEIIAIADDFLKEYGIDMSGYGPGVVQDYTRLYALGAATPDSVASASAAVMPYFQSEISVVYPLIIDGKTVYDQSGNENGLTVGVDITQDKVSYMYNLTSQEYQSSLYDTVQDTDKIIKAAENGAWYYYGSGSGGKELDLQTPFMGLTTTWKYDNDSGAGYELYVPALIFSVQNPPDNYFQKNVVVPVIKEFFDSTFNQVPPSPKPLPAQSSGK